MPTYHIQFHDKQIYEQLQKRSVGEGSLGVVAERALHRYLQLCRSDLPVFRVGEWCAIFDALNGCWLHETWSPRYVYAEVGDTLGLGEKWDIDQQALVAQLHGLTYGQCVAVVDAAEQFWQREGTEGESWYEEIVPIVGADHISKEA